MDKGFIKADARNLPQVNMDMVRCYLIENSHFASVEIQRKQIIGSTKQSYGDDAVGFVQLKRDNQLCIVKGRITPARKARKVYEVEIHVDEKEETVRMCKCHDCAAGEVCKHATALLLWLHRRSEDPPDTSLISYWRRPQIVTNSSSTLIIRARDMGSKPQLTSRRSESLEEIDIVNKFLKTVSSSTCGARLLNYIEHKEN